VPYALALLLWTDAIGSRAGLGWAQPVRAGLAVALLVAATRLRGRVGAAVALGYVLLVESHAAFAWSVGAEPSAARHVLLPATVLAAEAIAFDRSLSANARTIGVPSIAEHTARAALIALATLATLVAIYRSPLFAPDHTWVTIGWSWVAVVIMTLGFAFRSAEYRRTALVTLTLCVARAIVVDTQWLGDVAKPVTFVLLASCSLAAAWLYSRYAARIKEWL